MKEDFNLKVSNLYYVMSKWYVKWRRLRIIANRIIVRDDIFYTARVKAQMSPENWRKVESIIYNKPKTVVGKSRQYLFNLFVEKCVGGFLYWLLNILSNQRTKNNLSNTQTITGGRPCLSLQNWSGRDYLFELTSGRRKEKRWTKGRFHNLQSIFNKVNREQFNGKIKAKITWGRYDGLNFNQSLKITYGTYSKSEGLIRIHPALDSKNVPLVFIEHLIYHEMLHEYLPPIQTNVKSPIIHHYAFRLAEANSPTYKPAMKWQRDNAKMFDGVGQYR